MLTEHLDFDPDREAEAFAAAPAAPAVFLLRGADPQAEPYVSKTANLRRRLQRLLGPPEQTRRLNLRDRVHSIEYTPTGSDFESGFLLYGVLRAAFPKTYTDRLRLRFAPLLKLHMENEYPRASITTRLGRLGGRSLYYGPFPSRIAAEKFANDSLDFFKMRRCVDDLHPDPQFPGCIYSEMKMCLAPCFKGCTDEDYQTEVSRVQSFFDSGGHSLVREISAQREQASSSLEFESAAALHARVEKLKPVLGQLPEIVRRIDQLTAIIVQPSAIPESVAFFFIDAGVITAAHVPHPGPGAHQIAIDGVEGPGRTGHRPAANARTALETMEHLALLKRWFYRSTRSGEIFVADPKSGLPLRRLVRGIARVYRGEKPEAEKIDHRATGPS